jgi:hypothetical protein
VKSSAITPRQPSVPNFIFGIMYLSLKENGWENIFFPAIDL